MGVVKPDFANGYNYFQKSAFSLYKRQIKVQFNYTETPNPICATRTIIRFLP